MISSLTQHTYLVITLHQYTNVRYQEFIRGISFRHLLKKHNMNVFLIDEFRASRICPEYNNRSLVTFKNIENPRPHRRRTQSTVKCHGLVKYICTLLTWILINLFADIYFLYTTSKKYKSEPHGTWPACSF
jgi:hypothetical protein